MITRAKLERIKNRLDYEIWLMESALKDTTMPTKSIKIFNSILPTLRGIRYGCNWQYPKTRKYMEKVNKK